jgi:SAM-dependent methyltransferase
MKYNKQVDNKHYSFNKYYYSGRWISYRHEVDEILKREDISSVLDIGPGTLLLKNILSTFSPELVYKTVDIAEDINPDFVGGITSIPVDDETYDVVCAFQVLEHIEFRDFEVGLEELKRVSKKYVFISLPHFGPSIELQFKFPFIPRIRFAAKVPVPLKHEFGGQHYWEIGKRGYSVRKIRKILKKHFDLIDEYTPFENQYHHFYILKKYE